MLDERRLSHPPRTLDDKVLPVRGKALKLLLKRRTRTEVLASDDTTIPKGIHGAIVSLCAALDKDEYCAKVRNAILHNKEGYGIIFHMRHSPYNLIHALALTALLVAAILSRGFAFFWRQFLYGLNQTMTPHVLLDTLRVSTAMFGGLLLVFWISSLFYHPPKVPNDSKVPQASITPHRLSAIRFALLIAPTAFLIAIGMNVACNHLLEWMTGVKLADQELIRCLTDGTYSLPLRLLLYTVVLFQAPLFEEPLFRGIMFRGYARAMPVKAAMVVSGFIFALIHVNAATLLPLWFLGIVFAWLYHRTGSILAPMTCHFLFNAVNLILVLYFPELATT